MNWLRWLSGPPNVAKLKRNRDVDGLLRALRHESTSARKDAADAFREVADARCIEPLVGALQDPEKPVRTSAVRTLCELVGSVGEESKPRVAHALQPWLADDDLRSDVIRAWQGLGAVGELTTLFDNWSVGDWQTAVQTLRPMGWTPANDSQRIRTAIALKEWDRIRALGPEAAETLVAPQLSPPNDNPDLVAEGVAALGSLAVPPLSRIVEDPSSSGEVGQHAARLLGASGDSAAVPVLVRALDTPAICESAAAALSRLGWTPSTPHERLLHAKATNDVAALARLGETGVPALTRIVFGTSDCRDAALALGGIGGSQAISALKEILRSDRDQTLEIAVEALLGSPDPAAVLVLKARLEAEGRNSTKDKIARKMAARGGTALGALVSVLKSRDKEVRATVASALADVGWAPQDPDARLAFFVEYERWDDVAAMGAAAMGPLQSAAVHPAPGLRRVVQEAIGRKGGEWARGILVSGLADRVYAVRKAAATGLRTLGLEAGLGSAMDVKPAPTECAFCGSDLVDVGSVPGGLEYAIGRAAATQGVQAADSMLRAACACSGCGLAVCFPCFKYGKYHCPDCGQELYGGL